MAARFDQNRLVRKTRSVYSGPIFDAHIHVLRRSPDTSPPDPVRILDMLRNAGVESAIVMPTPNDGRWETHEDGVRLRAALAKISRGKIRQFGASNYLTYWMHEANRRGYSESDWKNIFRRLMKDGSGGAYAGLGEMGLYHFKKHAGQDVVSYPPTFGPFRNVIRFAAAKRLWVTLHAEPRSPAGKSYKRVVFDGVARLFHENPRLKLILAHTAMTNARNARRLLRAHRNLMMDIKFVSPRTSMRNSHTGGKISWDYRNVRHLEPVTNENGALYADWAKLFEEMPERFLVGTDARFGHSGWEFETYAVLVRGMRNILGAINAKAATTIAFENAKIIFDV